LTHDIEPRTSVDDRFIRLDLEGHRARLRLVDERRPTSTRRRRFVGAIALRA
jgi:hypothetical protein